MLGKKKDGKINYANNNQRKIDIATLVKVSFKAITIT